MNSLISIEGLEIIIFDFDGVLTNNKVYLNEKGEEFVSCNRSDGLAFKALNEMNKRVIIVSSEKNEVVTARGKKLGIEVFQGIGDKLDFIEGLAESEKFDLSKALYIGNDVNDFRIMEKVTFSACPADSHPMIKKISGSVLKTKGGEGVAREIVEVLLELDIIDVLYPR
tara:strand:- start:1959 stop:2465 length:507 start_codon:yes stop_codon:yes gene_type:complete